MFGKENKVTYYVDAVEFKSLQDKYGAHPKAIRIKRTILGEMRTRIEWKLKNSANV